MSTSCRTSGAGLAGRAAGIAAASLLWLASQPCGSVATPATERPLLGLAVNLPEKAGLSTFSNDLLAVRGLEVRAITLSRKWSELEPSPGVYQTDELQRAVVHLGAMGFRILLTIQTIDTNNLTMPPDLANRPFDSPETVRRLRALLARVVPAVERHVPWLAIGNEVDVYLAAHPASVEPYARLAEAGREEICRRVPGIRVGVTVTYDGLRAQRAMVERLERSMDVRCLTYYPLKAGFTVKALAQVGADFETMVSGAGGRPVLLQEVGCPASEQNGSSEAYQAAFVDAVFAAAERHRGRLAMLTFFMLYDFPDSLVTTLVDYYRLKDARFRAYLATLGLRKSDGTPRAAWRAFERNARAWRDRP